ncbi:MAG: DUF4457 domain-containing protein [Planctomycetales bacterium]|nr:DUF4457 domain-containing protein [Planctomycetales bacterium]
MKWQSWLTFWVCGLGCCANGVRADLIGYWPFDGSSEAIVGEDGFDVNGPLDVAVDRNGTARGALEFNGIDQYVEVSGGGGLDGVLGGTISMWVAWNGFQDSDCCGGTAGSVLARQANGQFSDNILTLSDPDPEFGSVVWRQSGGPAPALITGLDPVGDGQWRHIAVTFSPLGSELFIDGESQGTAVGNTPLNSNPDIPLSIGAWAGDGQGFSATFIDDVAIFDDILSGSQIASLFDGSKTPETVGPGTPVGEIPPPELPLGAIRATIHSVSSNLGDNSGFNRRADFLVDLSGWDDGTHVINPEGSMWLNNGSFVEPNDFDPEVTFDLGGVVSLDSVKVWNYNEDLEGRPELLGRGVAVADILIAGEDEDYSVLIEDQEFEIAPGDTTIDFGQVIELGGVQARYVRFAISENHGGDNDFVGLSEVIFFGDGGLRGDFDGSGVLDAADIDALSAVVQADTDEGRFDLDANGQVDELDRIVWVEELKNTWFGDSNMDGEFNSSDFVQIFTRGQFEDNVPNNSGWADGDWNGDGDFTTADFVAAFSDGGFEVGPRTDVAAVPEPSSLTLVIGGVLLLLPRRRP